MDKRNKKSGKNMSKKKKGGGKSKYSNVNKNMNMYDFYLTPKEQRLITYLNKNTAKIKTAREDRDRLENLSIKTIYKRWSDRVFKIINETIAEFNTLMNTKPSNALKDQKKLFTKYNTFLTNIVKIMVKDDRLLYVGITFIIVSMFVYFVSISASGELSTFLTIAGPDCGSSCFKPVAASDPFRQASATASVNRAIDLIESSFPGIT